jgi:hypothetical protein
MTLGDPDSQFPFERLWDAVVDRVSVIFPLRIIRQPERLIIQDYRPTLTMFLTALGFVMLAVSFIPLYFGMDIAIVSGLWTLAIPMVVCGFLLFKGTIREVYCFDRSTDTYTFVRQFIHRKEVIEGALSQFTSASVKTERQDDSETYYVVLKQEGMFLTGVGEQILREEAPVFNSFSKESRIANEISSYLHPRMQKPACQ